EAGNNWPCGYGGLTVENDVQYRNLTGNVDKNYTFVVPNNSIESIKFRSKTYVDGSGVYLIKVKEGASWTSIDGGDKLDDTSDSACASWSSTGGSGGCYEWIVCSDSTTCANRISDNEMQIRYQYETGGNLHIDYQALMVNYTGFSKASDTWNTTFACRSSGNFSWVEVWSGDLLSNGPNMTTAQGLPYSILCDADEPYFFADNSTNSTLSNTLIKLNISIFDNQSMVDTVYYTIDGSNVSQTAWSSTTSESYLEYDCSNPSNEGSHTWTYIFANDTLGNGVNSTAVNTAWTCDITSPYFGDNNDSTPQTTTSTSLLNQTVVDTDSSVSAVWFSIWNGTYWNYTADWYGDNMANFTLVCSEFGIGTWVWNQTWANDSTGNVWNYTDMYTTVQCQSSDASPPVISANAEVNVSEYTNLVIKLNQTITEETDVDVVFYTIENVTVLNWTASWNSGTSESWLELDCSEMQTDTYTWTDTWANDTLGNGFGYQTQSLIFRCDNDVPVILFDNETNVTVSNSVVKLNVSVEDHKAVDWVIYTINNV
ncbi:MAG: hypothetical protein KAT35_04760, partial [Candidatus Aenigmarchaeota archaeon]|nr:hypothetical protein [Candidatus Aenigmarchaeota archaeon]